jgi:hypothetical protein
VSEQGIFWEKQGIEPLKTAVTSALGFFPVRAAGAILEFVAEMGLAWRLYSMSSTGGPCFEL